MKIGGFQKTTLIDYPGKVACIVFTLGCNFRCPWCYSKELVLPEEIKKQPQISEKEFFSFLEKRKGLLDGVVICGGEPLIHKDIFSFLKRIKKLGFLVKLDTNGSFPDKLENTIDKKLVDYVAMDVKLPKKKYKEIYSNVEKIEESIDILKKGKVDFEFRTTVVPQIHSKEDILEIGEWIKGDSVKYFLQNFRAQKTIDPLFEKIKPFSEEFLKEIKKEISLKNCEIRS